MRTFLLFSVLFIAAIFADEICPTTSCVNGGQACTSHEACTRCSDAYSDCSTNAANDTQRCNCAKTLATCLYAKPQCSGSYFTVPLACGAVTNCTCGTEPTPATYTFLTCKNGYYCGYTQGANTDTCLASKVVGASCDKSSGVNECGSADAFDDAFRTYRCELANQTNNTVCTEAPYGYDNYLCSKNSNCYSDNCVAGKCVGKTAGQTCQHSAQCAFGLFCNNGGNCATEIADGASCTVTQDEPCKPFSVCGAGDTCTPAFSKANGATCRREDECGLGLWCINNTCRTFNTATRIPCNSTNDHCSDYLGACSCDGVSTSKYCAIRQRSGLLTQECYDSSVALRTCLNTNKCDTVDYTDESCSSQFCKTEANCFFNCFSTGGGAVSCNTLPQPECPSDDSAASFLTISFGVFIALMSLF